MEIKIPAEKIGYTITVKGEFPRVVCPYCKCKVSPVFKYGLLTDERFLVTCPECESQFFLATTHTLFTSYLDRFEVKFAQDNEWSVVTPPKERVETKLIPDIVNTISPCFGSIYNEAYAARQLGYTQICGGGYRKALEFLIKDYATFLHPDKEKEIAKMELGNCIKKYVDNPSIQIYSNRASWLGNDELHYRRVWENKDIFDLEALIEASILAIKIEEERKKLEIEMPKLLKQK